MVIFWISLSLDSICSLYKNIIITLAQQSTKSVYWWLKVKKKCSIKIDVAFTAHIFPVYTLDTHLRKTSYISGWILFYDISFLQWKSFERYLQFEQYVCSSLLKVIESIKKRTMFDESNRNKKTNKMYTHTLFLSNFFLYNSCCEMRLKLMKINNAIRRIGANKKRKYMSRSAPEL